MTASPATYPRRVTIVAPETRVDVALPPQASIGEVTLQVVDLIGEEQLDPTGSAGGWLLSRVGETPLEPGRSVASTDVHDGDILHLSPRSTQLPPALFDDVVDAIAEASLRRPDRWDTATTRRACLVVGGGLALAALFALARSGLQPAVAVAIDTITVLAALAAGAGLSRAAGDAGAGLAVTLSAVPYAAWAGGTVGASGELSEIFAAPTVLLAGAAVTATCALAAIGVGRYYEVFGAFGAVGLTATIGAATSLVWGASGTSVAGIVGALAMLMFPALPMLSVRLARLPLPVVPVDMGEFRKDEMPIVAADIVGQARRGDRVLTWILTAIVMVVSACSALLLTSDRWPGILAAVLSAILVLRARRFLGRAQRLVLLVPGLFGLLAAGAVWMTTASLPWRLVAVAVMVVVATSLVGYSLRLPRRGARPYAARTVDVVEFIGLAAILPIVGAVLGLYSRLRGLAG
jgi:type VII secretion integral membrane protein EccD